MSILFKKHLQHARFSYKVSSLEQYINHIPRWWARIFSEYEIISFPLFPSFKLRDILLFSLFSNLFVRRNTSHRLATLAFESVLYIMHWINILWVGMFIKLYSIVLRFENIWTKFEPSNVTCKCDMEKEMIKYETIMSLELPSIPSP